MEALRDQGPLGLVDGLTHQVLIDQRRAVVRPHLAQDHEFGVLDFLVGPLVGAPGVDLGAHRHEQQQVGEGQVGQDAPAPEQALEVLELVGLQVGVALGELGRGGHQASWASRAGDTGTA